MKFRDLKAGDVFRVPEPEAWRSYNRHTPFIRLRDGQGAFNCFNLENNEEYELPDDYDVEVIKGVGDGPNNQTA